MDLPEIITPELIKHIKQTYSLSWTGIHGWDHWVRVYENGMRLAQINGADREVVAMFAFTHDMARLNDGHDPEHGPRAAARIRTELQGTYINFSPEKLVLLLEAVEKHTRGTVLADITVQTCWDSGPLGFVPGRNHPRPKVFMHSSSERS